MKKLTPLLYLGAILMFGLFSCKDDGSDNAWWDSDLAVSGTYPGLVNSASSAVSSGLPFSWRAGDAICLYIDPKSDGNGSNIRSTRADRFSTFGLASGTGTQNARFIPAEGFAIDPTVNGSRTFYAAYPVKSPDNATGVDDASMSNYTGTCTFDLERVQQQQKGTDLAGLGKYLLMWADPVADGAGVSENLDFRFGHQCASLWFNLRNVPQGVNVTAVEITEVNAAGQPVTGSSDALCFMTRMELGRKSTAGERTYGTVTSGYVNSMRVEMSSPVGGDFTARLAVIPHDCMTDGTSAVNNAKGADAIRHFAVVVHTEDDTYTFDRPNEKSGWKPGYYYQMNLDFAGKPADSQTSSLVRVDAQYPSWIGSPSPVAESWASGDAIYLYIDPLNTGKGSNIEKTQTEYYSICNRTGSDGKQAPFVAPFGFTFDPETNETRTFYGAYPARISGVTGVDTESFANGNGTCTFLLSREQIQNASASNLRDYLLMWADPVLDADRSPGNLGFSFNHLCAVLEFNVRNLPLGMSVSAIEIREVSANGQPLGGGSSHLCFMNRMELNRASTAGNLNFGKVEMGYYGSVKVEIQSPLIGNKTTARIAVIPHDYMTDGNGEAVNNAKGAGAVRNFAVVATTTKGTYTFDKPDTPSYWEPGKIYAMTLDFTGMTADTPPPPGNAGDDFENGGPF